MLLECPRCLHSREWTREVQPDGPGECFCGTFQDWRVLKKPREPGHVRLLTDKGWVDLKPPFYRDPR